MPYAEPHYFEKKAEWSRDYYEREKERVLGIKASWRTRNPEKRRAHVAVGNAIRDGKLFRGPCEVGPEGCEGKIHAHHDDYGNPLDVRWICSRHHGETRRKAA